MLDRSAFERAARGTDIIFHTAAAITPSGGWEVYRRLNVDGTEHAIAAAEASGARLMQVSSVAVYGPAGRYRVQGKTDEETPLGPLPDGIDAVEAAAWTMIANVLLNLDGVLTKG